MAEKWKKILFDLFLSISGGVAIASSRGLEFLISNQNTYFLYGLRLHDPNFIKNDWFTWNVFPHHFAFGYFLLLLQKLGSLYPLVILSQIVVMCFLALGLLMLCRRLCSYPIPVYLMLILWMASHNAMEVGLGWQPIILGYLQPAEIASGCMIFGLALMFEQKYLWSSIMLGLGGLFNAAYLSSFGLTIMVTALAIGLLKKPKDVLSFTMPLLVTWGLVFLTLSQVLKGSPADAQTMTIWTNFRHPGDYILSNWSLKWTLNWFAWSGIGALSLFYLSKERSNLKVVQYSYLAALITCIIGILCLVFVKIPSLSLMMLWRVAWWPVLLGLVVGLDYILSLVIKPERWQRKETAYLILIIILSVFLISNSRSVGDSITRALWFMTIPAAMLIGKMKMTEWWEYRLKVVGVIGILSVLLLGRYSFKGLTKYSENHLVHAETSAVAQMEEWIAKNTPTDSVLVVPPDKEYMRIRVRRAIVVDWKSTPCFSRELKEWYKRICEQSGISPATPPRECGNIMDGYLNLDAARARFLKRSYAADYVVVAKNHRGNLSGLRERFVNEEYKVLEIPN